MNHCPLPTVHVFNIYINNIMWNGVLVQAGKNAAETKKQNKQKTKMIVVVDIIFVQIKNICIKIDNLHTPWGPGDLSRECVLRIPMRVVKGD